MSVLRWSGFLIGAVLLICTFSFFRRGRLRRMDFALLTLFSGSLITATAVPDSITLLRDMMRVAPGQHSRLIALAIVSNIFLWLLLFYTRFRWGGALDKFDGLVRELAVAEFDRSYPEVKTFEKVTVLIAAYNEAENIGPVLADMPDQVLGQPFTVLVIDDGSEDETLEKARAEGYFAIRAPVNRGDGAALRIGFDIARRKGAEIVVTMDADGQHQPAEIEKLVEPVAGDRFDFVIGSRILGDHESDSRVRYFGIHFFNTVIRILTPAKITDCSSGFRAFRLSELGKVMLRQDKYHTAELIVEAARKGIRVGEVPIVIKRRQGGETKKGRNFSYGLNFARTVMKTWWR